MGLMDKVVFRMAKKKINDEAVKKGDHCEHKDLGVCDDCIKAAIGIAKEQANALSFGEKIKLMKEAKKKPK